jgi:hypothetical protein
MDIARTMRGFWSFTARLALSGCANSNQPGRGELFAANATIHAKDDSICRQHGAKAGEPVHSRHRVVQDETATRSRGINLLFTMRSASLWPCACETSSAP